MSHRRSAAALALLAVTATGIVSGCGDDEGDEATFCRRYDRLVADDPFEDQLVVEFEEMRAAFDVLLDGAEGVAAAAPDTAEPVAIAYLRTVEHLIELLDEAGFDPRQLDTDVYASATDDYFDAAQDLERTANAACERS